MFISSEIWYDNLWYFQNLYVELRRFRTLLPVFFRQPHHLVNSSAETHGNSTTSTSTSPTSSPTKKNIHQPSPIKHGFPIPNPKPQQQHSKSFQSPTASCPTSPCSTWPPRCYSPRCLPASPCARPWPPWKQRRHRRRTWFLPWRDEPVCSMGSDFWNPKDDFIYEMRNMCLKPIFFHFFPSDPILEPSLILSFVPKQWGVSRSGTRLPKFGTQHHSLMAMVNCFPKNLWALAHAPCTCHWTRCPSSLR